MRLTLTPLSGDVAMYVSATEHRPNATRHTWAATEGTAGGALSLTIAYDDASLATCVRYAPQCVLYLSVVGVAPSTLPPVPPVLSRCATTEQSRQCSSFLFAFSATKTKQKPLTTAA